MNTRPYCGIIITVALLMPAFQLTVTQADEPKPTAETRRADIPHTLEVAGRKRFYIVHVPENYNPATPTPVVLALHGAAMNGTMMVGFTGLNETSEKHGFLAVYPSGTGTASFLTWNAGGFAGAFADNRPDDVAFIRSLLDDLAKKYNIDQKRVFACGMSNGGMMCYRLAAELSDRIAAVAPVAGTIAINESKPARPVPVIHFHGLKDRIVPYIFDKEKTPSFMRFKGVEDSVMTWVRLNGCSEMTRQETISKPESDMKVTRRIYSGGKNGSEVVLIVVEEGGHTWPGQRQTGLGFIGKSTVDVSANDLMWEFFQKHPMK